MHTLSDLPGLLKQLAPTSIHLLVDTNTRIHCLPVLQEAVSAFAKTQIITIPAGEQHKSIASTQLVWQALIDNKADRKAVLVNLGGGVVTDLGGYAAGSYKRGIRFVHIPTTVLSQVDAALGGKTGVDFGGVKNSVGLFQMPAGIIADPIFLKTLPAREVRSGMAEMYKHALISGTSHWAQLKATSGRLLTQSNVGQLIADSQQIKLNIVAQDPQEQGTREALNFGHSVGHAIESLLLETGTPALHGEAIAAGMICEAYLSEALTGLKREVVKDVEETLLEVYGKLEIHADSMQTLLALMANDKKNKGGQIRMSLLRKIGDPCVGIAVNDEVIKQSIVRYCGL